MHKYIYHFLPGAAEGSFENTELLGGKGANLAEMCNLNLPVPPGFTITSEVCGLYKAANFNLPKEITQQITDAIKTLEKKTNKIFGGINNPLLVSVRSGSKFSMPGMLDTILNVGLNDQIIENISGNIPENINNSENNPKNNSENNVKNSAKISEQFLLDSYRRLIQMYGNVVLKIDNYHFEEFLFEYKQAHNIKEDSEIRATDLKIIIQEFKEIILKSSAQEFPQDIYKQLYNAINAVFASWNNKRAATYRKLHNIAESVGTAVNIQAMVFGNLNGDSASGVVFSRNPSTGENKIFGEYIQNAQGEDVVSGARTPENIEIMADSSSLFFSSYLELVRMSKILEAHYKDMQDIEFTIENNKLWLLQTRSGKRSAEAAIKIAVEMVKEEIITKEAAILKIIPKSIESLLHPRLSEDEENLKNLKVIARGLPASPGAVSGKVVFCTEEAVKRASAGEKIILVKNETNPEDIAGMSAACGIITTRGGMTSHAAVVTRGMGKPCICACNINLDPKGQCFTLNKSYNNYNSAQHNNNDNNNDNININSHNSSSSNDSKNKNNNSNSHSASLIINKDDIITIDGGKGIVILGNAKTLEFKFSEEFNIFMQWVEEFRKLGVRANAETKEDIHVAKKFQADGIGLCRTEHMFFAKDRINIVRAMILAEDSDSRKIALEKLLPIQTQDFIEIFKEFSDKTLTIRLLDPPLHEFLPVDEESLKSFCEYSKLSESFVARRANALKEQNPMLGHRGCRLAVTYPEIYQMQIEAIFSAAENFPNIKLEIMVPFILNELEFNYVKKLIEEIALTHSYKSEPNEGKAFKPKYSLGNMIELPSAALLADKIAKYSDFFSFGTNDLTQTTLGLSRDDSAQFLTVYQEKQIIKADPFASIIKESVGELMKLAIIKGRKVKEKLKIGVCGEHGGDPDSIEFFIGLGIDYVSCSPYRIPIAKITAAQVAIRNEGRIEYE